MSVEKELAEFAAWLRSKGYKEKTVERYCYTARRHLEGKPPRSRSDRSALRLYEEFLKEARRTEKEEKPKRRKRRGIFIFPWW